MAASSAPSGKRSASSLAFLSGIGILGIAAHSFVFAAPDNTDPTCGTWSPNGTSWSSSNITFTLSNSTDSGGSGIDVSGGSCVTTYNWDTCQVTIRDKAGNTRTCTSPSAKIDTVDPSCGSWNPAGTGWGKTSVNFTLSNSTDGQSGIDVAGGSCTVNSDGGTCQVTIRDKAGNTRTCTSPSWRVDSTPPLCDTWSLKSPPSTTFTQWNGQYDEWSIPWTQDQKSIFVTGTDTGGSGMSATQYWCSETNQSVSIAFCTATISDKAGNTRVCGGPNESPRVRQDNSAPPKPSVSCSLIDTTKPGEYTCQINVAPTGPSPTSVFYKVGAAASWNFNGRYWFLSQNGSFVAQDTHTLTFPLNVTPGTQVSVYVKFEETGGDSFSDAYTFTASSSAPVDPPVSTNPNPTVEGTQTFSYVDDTGDWYACGTSLSWPTLPEGVGTPSASSNTYCGSDGDGWSYPAGGPGTVGNGGSRTCMCRDAVPPTVNSISASTTGWTNAPITFNASIGGAAADGSAYRGIWYSCNGGSLIGPSGATNVSFTCSWDGASAQIATIKSCDALQCTQRTITYYKETTKPTGTLAIQGKVGNHDGEVTKTDTNSAAYTKTPTVTLSYSATDTGGSNLDVNPIKISCSSNPAGVGIWESIATGTKTFNLTTGPWCDATQGTKTVYMHMRDIAGNVNTVSSSIVYDTQAPTFTTEGKILLFARGGYVYTVQGASDPGGSWLRDYTIAWYENGDLLDQSVDSASSSKNFGDLARYINENDSDGKREATINILIEDRAGNYTSKTVDVVIISAMASFDSDSFLDASRNPVVGDLSDTYTYKVKLRDSNGNIIRPVTGIRKIGTRWEMENTSSFLGTGDYNDGAVWYDWDGNGYSPNVSSNSYYADYENSNQKTDGIYRIGVKSAVPTKQGYPDYTNNQIRLTRFEFENVLSAASSDASGCPNGFVCTGTNANSTFNRTLSVNLANDAGMSDYLAFKPAIEATPSKNFSVLTDNSWHAMTVTFKNNSISRSFSLDQYKFAFHYANDLGPFADIRIRGDLGEFTSYPDSYKKVLFTFGTWLPNVPESGSVTKNVEIQTNSYGYGFGKFWFSAYLPYDGADNRIGWIYDTGYNTANLGLLTGVTGFESTAVAVPASSFGDGVAEGQKIAVRGSIGDKWNNALSATLEGGVKVDARSTDRLKLKSNVRQNAFDMTRTVASDNGTDCMPVLTSLASKDVYYYDFSELTNGTPINGNPGCYVTVRGVNGPGGSGYRELGVSGKKTIIIKWGNAYLDSDAYYESDDSMLAIVVLRDERNKKKGGNILVNPMVTNVVGAAFAEGSIISYDGNKIFEKDTTYEGELTRQLLWYGSVYSSNTVGGSLTSGTSWKCPYGSDTYESTGSESCSQSEASKYDFAALRRFVLFNATSGSCVSASQKSAKSSGTSSESYAFAGKPQCFQSQTASLTASGKQLRKTSETAPFVVEYNPVMQTSGMRVFSSK